MTYWLGIDLGKARIGLALSNRELTFAHPAGTLNVYGDPLYAIDDIITMIENELVSRVIVGLPLLLSAKEGSSAANARRWAAQLASALQRETAEPSWQGCAPVDVELFDERLTTVDAHRQLTQAGRSQRARKTIIDQQSATILLQSALDMSENTRNDA